MSARIGIFGGTFNPVHQGHLRCAEEVHEMLALDRVLFVPSFDPPLKTKSLVPFSHRLKMVRRAVSGNAHFSVSAIEANIRGKSYTVHSVEALQGEYPGARLHLILGADAFVDLPRWLRPLDILEATDTVVVARPPFGFSGVLKSPFLKVADREKIALAIRRGRCSVMISRGKRKLFFVTITALDISATAIRKRLRAGRSVKYLLPPSVESYIISHNLYAGISERSHNPKQS
ncbi:MAG: nicotinate (nicotinamide) nucleotide adenylyltransferase [Thermodesulfovibrionales bacterium]